MKLNQATSLMLMVLAGTTVSLSALPGCTPKPAEQTAFVEPPPKSLREARPFVNKTRPVSQPIEFTAGRHAPTTQLLDQTRLTASAPATEGLSSAVLDGNAGNVINVKIAANNQAAAEVFRIIFGEYLKMSYVVDTKASGGVTLDVDEEMTRTDIIDFAASLCAIYGWVLEIHENTAYIRGGDMLARADAPIMQARAGLGNDLPAIRVKRLKYVGGEQALAVVKDLMSAGAKAAVQGRTIVLVDTARQVNKLAKLLAAIDAPAFEGTEIWTYRLGTRRPEDAKKVLEAIATGAGLNSTADAQVAFVDVTGTDRLLVISKDPTLQPVLRGFVEIADQPLNTASRQRFIYHVQHMDAPALQTFLKSAFADRIEPEGTTKPSNDTTIRLVLDQQEGLLMIYATPDDYAEVMATLQMVDRPRMQVSISSIIAEVGLTGRLEYGVEYFLRALDADGIGIAELVGTPGLPAGATAGAFFTAGDGFAVVKALQNESNVNLVSLPQISIRNRDKGSIQVGGEVPIVKADIDSSTQQDGNTGIRRSIEYRKTGVILDIEPQINERGEVTMKITQEVTAVGQQTDLGPEFTTRKIETKVTVPSGRTVLLGGIIDNAKRDTVSKIPLLADIPLLGLAFQTQKLQDVRTELLLAITPSVIVEPSDGNGELSEFMARASVVREAIYDLANDMPRGMLRFDSAPAPPVFPEGPEEPAKLPGQVEGPADGAPMPAAPTSPSTVSPGSVHG